MRAVVLLVLLLFIDDLNAQPRRLSLEAAIQAALENNATVQISEEVEIQAAERVRETRSALIPAINGSFSHTNQTVNLGSAGIRIPQLPTGSKVGPFNVTDVRAQTTASVFDLSLIRRYRAVKRTAQSSRFETDAARRRASAAVARLYFNMQRASELVRSAEAQVELDDSLLRLARDRRDGGVGTNLDVTRAEARLAADRHQLLQFQNERRTAEYQLLRAMGERMDVRLDLSDSLSDSGLAAESIETAVARAIRERVEVQAAEERIAAARVSAGAARAERLPVVQAFADYGNNGSRDTFVPTNRVGVQVQIPLFDGGRRSSHRATAASTLRQEEIRARDLRDEIEMETRVAFDALASSREQLRAAAEALRLANEELELARLRLDAGVSTPIDVITAQTALSAARSRNVNALFALKSAEIDYLRATGQEVR